MTMPDREKIIKEWESILNRDPLDAPWDLIDDNYHFCKVCGQEVKWK